MRISTAGQLIDIFRNKLLFRQRFQGYRCESDIALFTWFPAPLSENIVLNSTGPSLQHDVK